MNYNNDVVIDMNGIWISVYSKITFFCHPREGGDPVNMMKFV